MKKQFRIYKKGVTVNSFVTICSKDGEAFDRDAKMAKYISLGYTVENMEIVTTDLKPGINVKLQSGTVFIVESIESGFVRSSLLNGTKNNYRTEISDDANFFNENKAIIL